MKMKFEEALTKLEKIVEEMESGEVSLEKSIAKYEEGMKLVSFCTQKLNEAEKKIEIIMKNKNGVFTKESFKDKEKKKRDEPEVHQEKKDEELSFED
jgi:exodeoxyribonuclease VII small subunit